VKTRSIFIAFVVVVIAVAGVLLMKKNLKVNKLLAPSVTPTIQQKIESKFLGLNIPTDAERAELKDVSGGSGIGLATRTEILAFRIHLKDNFIKPGLKKMAKRF
jgi:hypothetical protein